MLRDLARLRATAVCKLLAQQVPGVRTQVNIALSGDVQLLESANQSTTQPQPHSTGSASSQVAGATPVRISANDLQRRVLVVARPGQR